MNKWTLALWLIYLWFQCGCKAFGAVDSVWVTRSGLQIVSAGQKGQALQMGTRYELFQERCAIERSDYWSSRES